MARTGPWALLLADVIAVFHAHRLSSVLPARVASHFDAFGNPNGWMTREELGEFYVGFVLILSLLLFAASRLVQRLSSDLISLPFKSYWFAPEREAFGRARLGGQLCWLGVLVVGLMIVVMRVVARVSLGEPELARTAFPKIIVGFILAMIAFTTLTSIPFGRRNE
jgi:hypothetical protein